MYAYLRWLEARQVNIFLQNTTSTREPLRDKRMLYTRDSSGGGGDSSGGGGTVPYVQHLYVVVAIAVIAAAGRWSLYCSSGSGVGGNSDGTSSPVFNLVLDEPMWVPVAPMVVALEAAVKAK